MTRTSRPLLLSTTTMLLLFLSLLISSSSASLLSGKHMGPMFLPEDVPVKHLMFKPRGVCGDFLEGACDLSENNIVGHNRFTDTPGECQDLCQADPTCHWFTHFDTQCYLLTDCGNSAHCSGCVSGPENPDFGTCPWPPHPTVEPTTPKTTTTTKSTTTTTKSTTTTTKSTTTTTKSTTTTTKSTTTTTKSTTTTTKKTTTTTKRTTTTPDPKEGCDDIHINSECDWNYGLITWYEQVMTGAECQYICKNVNGAKFFSHYNEGHHGEHGFCGCFSSCAWPTTEGCDASCETHETFEESDEERFLVKRKMLEEQLDSGEMDGGEVDVELKIHGQPRPGPKYCHCMRGPLSPDADTCDLWG